MKEQKYTNHVKVYRMENEGFPKERQQARKC
jgi:hypothetical protein